MNLSCAGRKLHACTSRHAAAIRPIPRRRYKVIQGVFSLYQKSASSLRLSRYIEAKTNGFDLFHLPVKPSMQEYRVNAREGFGGR